jgi:hypothetical protein
MPLYKVSEKTMAILPQLIAQAGITNPIVGIQETETSIEIYLLAHTEPVIIQKPRPPAPKTKPKPKPRSRQTAAKKKAR